MQELTFHKLLILTVFWLILNTGPALTQTTLAPEPGGPMQMDKDYIVWMAYQNQNPPYAARLSLAKNRFRPVALRPHLSTVNNYFSPNFTIVVSFVKKAKPITKLSTILPKVEFLIKEQPRRVVLSVVLAKTHCSKRSCSLRMRALHPFGGRLHSSGFFGKGGEPDYYSKNTNGDHR